MAVVAGLKNQNHPSPVPSREAMALAAQVLAGKMERERAVDTLAERYLPRGFRPLSRSQGA